MSWLLLVKRTKMNIWSYQMTKNQCIKFYSTYNRIFYTYIGLEAIVPVAFEKKA